MGVLVRFPRHARASARSGGYKSGRNSDRDTPEIRSTSKTLSGGTSSHWETAWIEMPRGSARPLSPPASLIARRKASLRSLMVENSSMALGQSQVPLHRKPKAVLYTALAMKLGERIKLARKRLRMTQKELGDKFGISEQAVSGWERGETTPEYDKLSQLRLVLRVNYAWLMEGNGDPPEPDALEVLLDDDFTSAPRKVRSSIAKAIDGLRKRG